MVVESIDRSILTALYPGGGCPAHDPQVMLKVVLLAYAQGICSSHRINQATCENVGFLWICDMQPLDHSTVNRFRSKHIHPVSEEVFSKFISLLAYMGLVTLDGTKIEANANRLRGGEARGRGTQRRRLRDHRRGRTAHQQAYQGERRGQVSQRRRRQGASPRRAHARGRVEREDGTQREKRHRPRRPWLPLQDRPRCHLHARGG